MSTTTTTRDAKARRTYLAFEAARSRGWDREQVMEAVGISRATYYRLEDQRRRIVANLEGKPCRPPLPT